MKCHVNIRWSTEVCVILTKKSLSPFSCSSFSFPLFLSPFSFPLFPFPALLFFLFFSFPFLFLFRFPFLSSPYFPSIIRSQAWENSCYLYHYKVETSPLVPRPLVPRPPAFLEHSTVPNGHMTLLLEIDISSKKVKHFLQRILILSPFWMK